MEVFSFWARCRHPDLGSRHLVWGHGVASACWGELGGVSFVHSPHPDGFPGSLQESEDAVKALAKEKDLLEREKWELRRQAKEATDHASALRSQLDLKDNRMKELEAELAMVSSALLPHHPPVPWRGRELELQKHPRVSPVHCCGLSAQQIESLETPGSFDLLQCFHF